MANYRRLISYIYAYEGGIKGKNVGFAKIENRKDQCRIQVSVRNVYVGSQDIGVYLMSTEGERLLGKMFIRGGAGEFRCMVQMDNGMSDCYGLTIHSIGDSWQSYTTIWEDAVAHAAEVDLSDAVSEKMEQKEMEQIPTDQIPEQAPGNPVCQRSVAEAIEAELEAEEQKVPWEEPEIPDVPPEPQLPPVPEILPNPPEPVPVTEPATEPERVPVIEPGHGTTACNPTDDCVRGVRPSSGASAPGVSGNTFVSSNRPGISSNRPGIRSSHPGCRQRRPGSHISASRRTYGSPETLEFLQPHISEDPGV